jgi:hypothetical protein
MSVFNFFCVYLCVWVCECKLEREFICLYSFEFMFHLCVQVGERERKFVCLYLFVSECVRLYLFVCVCVSV